MKKIILLLASIFTVGCHAQTPIYTLGGNPGEVIPKIFPNNCYIKDANNILNKFEGTWIYNQNGQNFTITLQKAEMVHSISYYKDMLFGQYIYTVNNTTVVNTTYLTGEYSRINGFRAISSPTKLKLFFYDPERPKMGSVVELTYSNTAGVEKLNWRLYQEAANYSMENEPPAQFDFRVPTNCELIKQ